MPVEDTFVPVQTVDTRTPAQDQHDACFLKEKNEHLRKLIERLSKTTKCLEAFCTWITFQEDILSYHIHEFYSDESPERLNFLVDYSRKLATHPGAPPESKARWKGIYRGHLVELMAQNKTPESPETIAAQKEEERVAAELLAADEQKALDERRAEQARIRALKEVVSTESSDDDDLAPATTNEEPARPKAIETLLGDGNIETQTQTKLNAAVAEIAHNRKPTAYRGTIGEVKMPYKGKNRLIHHCIVDDTLRLYYVFTKESVLLLDVSNHDMERLKQICSTNHVFE